MSCEVRGWTSSLTMSMALSYCGVLEEDISLRGELGRLWGRCLQNCGAQGLELLQYTCQGGRHVRGLSNRVFACGPSDGHDGVTWDQFAVICFMAGIHIDARHDTRQLSPQVQRD